MSHLRLAGPDLLTEAASTPTAVEGREVGRLMEEVQFRAARLQDAYQHLEVAVAAAVVEGGCSWASLQPIVAPHRSVEMVRRDFAGPVQRYRLELDDVPVGDYLRTWLGVAP